jgi:hypothetical protein
VINTPPAKPAKPTITLSFANVEAPVLSASAAFSYQWHRNNVAIANATAVSYTVTTEGSYTVVVFSEAGCASESSLPQVLVITDIDNPFNSSAVQLYPNPVANELTVILHGFETGREVSLSVTDMLGRTRTTTTGFGGKEIIIDVRQFTDGQYTLQMQQGLISKRKTFIKKTN